MHLYMYAKFLVMLGTTACTLSCSEQYRQVVPHLSRFRRQLSPLYTAWRQLLKGAWLSSKGPHTRWYNKIGGQKEAISDFNSLKPTTVVESPDGLSGKVGNRNVHVFSSKDLTILGIMGKGTDSAIAPYNGFRAIQYIKRRKDADKMAVPPFKNNYFK